MVDLGEVEAVDGGVKAVEREPVGFVEFVVKYGEFKLAVAFEEHEEVLVGELWKEAEVVFVNAGRFDGDVQDVDAWDVVGGGQTQRARGEFVDERHTADVLVEVAALLRRESIGKRGE